MIELRGVTKMFGAKRAVDRLDLRVRAGELFAFLGPNGAGKTTTIKMVCGLLAPTAGTVRVGGFLASSQEARQLLAYVPDQPYLYDKLTVRERLQSQGPREDLFLTLTTGSRPSATPNGPPPVQPETAAADAEHAT